MRKKVISTIFLLSILFCFSCSKEPKKDIPIFFADEAPFHIGFKTETTQTKAKLFIDQTGALHLLHEDTSSPLFGLEEIFSEDGVKSHFYELEFENSPYSGGVTTIYRALITIQNEECISKERTKGLTTYNYKTDQMDFSFTFTENTYHPVRIFGKDDGIEFDINFSTDA